MKLSTESRQCLKQLKSFVKCRKEQLNQPQQKLKMQQILYGQFLALLRSKQAKNGYIADQIDEIQRVLQQQLRTKKESPNITIKRGRPIKNFQSQKKLVQWIVSQQKTTFHKYQLEVKYCELKGQDLKHIPLKDFRLILQRFQVHNVEVIGQLRKKGRKQKGVRKEECLHVLQESFGRVEQIYEGDNSFFKFSHQVSPRESDFPAYITSIDQFLENGNSRQFDFF